ncbi:MAG: hypothetical protein LIV11_06815 [Bacillota bacterium]|nr:hypothetical protein [Bacillota bacterium]
MKIVRNYENIVRENYAKLYKYAFVESCHDISAKDITFQSLLYSVDPERSDRSVWQNAHSVLNDFFLRSLRRRRSRDEIAAGVTFPIRDELWNFLERPTPEKEALFLMAEAGLTKKEAADIMAVHVSRLPDLSQEERSRISSLLSVIVPDGASEEEAADRVLLRFTERSVGFENRLRDLRLFFDRHILWLAAAIALFCAAAAYCTA